MLASKQQQSSSKSSSTAKSGKSLSVPMHRDEAKTPETETVLGSSMNKDKPKSKSLPSKSGLRSPSPSGAVKRSPLSSRAQRVKQSLKEKKDVSAVVLKEDGLASEILYNGSSKQANIILGGRPTIIGEYEELGVIIVRSLNQSQGKLNQTILPVPFCNKQFRGPYLLYKVDQNGNPSDLRLSVYEKFVANNKALTESARKNYNPIDDQQIRPKSSFSSNSKLTLVYLRSEVDKKIRAEYEKKTGKKPTESDIELEVNVALQKLVDELVSSSSPMNDPDYNPSEEEEKSPSDTMASTDTMMARLKKVYSEENGQEIDNAQLLSALENTKTLLATENHPDYTDDRDWRLQLNDALNYVRERGRLDGRILAEKISETFYELNGKDPSLDELIDVFRRIKAELAAEAEEDLIEQGLISRPKDNGSAYFLAQKLGTDFNNADPADIIDYAFRIVREDLVSRGKSLFMSTKGRSPNKEELKEVVESLAMKLAKEALDRATLVEDKTMKLHQDDDSVADEDYDPNNVMDKRLLREDRKEDEQFDEDYFNLRMLTTDPEKSPLTGKSQKYDVYFCKFSAKRKARNLEQACATFKLRNKREPNALEIAKIKQFISMKPTTNLIQFKLAVMSDSDNDGDLEEKSDMLLSQKHLKKAAPTTPSKVLVTPVKQKKTAARYNVYFGRDTLDQKKNEQLALKWFKRFNHRAPTELELAGIKQFVAADKSQLTECEYEVPVDLKDMVDGHKSGLMDDDRKETEEDDKFSMKKRLKFNEKDVVRKERSTKYTLNFDNERENGDEQQALKWFKRFNNRGPTDDELDAIKQFVKADNDETVDID